MVLKNESVHTTKKEALRFAKKLRALRKKINRPAKIKVFKKGKNWVVTAKNL